MPSRPWKFEYRLVPLGLYTTPTTDPQKLLEALQTTMNGLGAEGYTYKGKGEAYSHNSAYRTRFLIMQRRIE